MAVRYMHVRKLLWNFLTEDYDIDPRGGVTIAYTMNEISKEIICAAVKCKSESTVDEYLLAKRENALRNAMAQYKSGVDDAKTFFAKMRKVEAMRTSEQELFCYKTGRERAKAKLQAPDGEFDIIDLVHPASEQLADWLATVVWPSGPESFGYRGSDMGFAIDVMQDDKGRWVSTFEPSDVTDPIAFEADVPNDEGEIVGAAAYIPESQEFLHP